MAHDETASARSRRQLSFCSERGEVASWLILLAGLCMAVALASSTLGGTISTLASNVGVAASGPNGTGDSGASVDPNNNGDATAGDSGATPNDTGKYHDSRRIVGWDDVGHPLYADGIHPDDVMQGAISDCFFVSSLAALANLDPDIIRDAIVDNGDGTYTVTLYDGGERRDITVTGEIPIAEYYDEDTDTWFPGRAPAAGAGDGELWVRVMEKAYASMLGDGDLIEGYRTLNQGGSGATAIEVITGLDATYTSKDPSVDDLRAFLAEGPVLASSHEFIPGSGWWIFGRESGQYAIGDDQVTTWHLYWVDEIHDDGTITIRNPWDFDTYVMEMSIDEFNEAFRGITHSDQVE